MVYLEVDAGRDEVVFARCVDRVRLEVDLAAMPIILADLHRGGGKRRGACQSPPWIEPITGGEAVYTQRVNQSQEGRQYIPSV